MGDPQVLRPDVLQRRALRELRVQLRSGGRGLVVMPCGAGKTLLGRWYAEQITAQLVVVVVPTLALAAQTVVAYRSDGAWPHHTMVVCSDESTGQAVAGDDLSLPRWARESVTASTSTWAVQHFLETATAAGTARVIVSTYHSAPRLAAALRRTGMAPDLVVCDEAHRLAGRPRTEFRSVLTDAVLPARRRLFLTATPITAEAPDDETVVAPLSLDDDAVFGPRIYHASFEEAIAAGRLVDYDVHVVAVRSPTGDSPAQRSTAAEAVVAAATDGSSRILTFHTRVAHARALVAEVAGRELPDGRRVRAEHLQARHRVTHRSAALHRLANPEPGEVAVLASARVLTEGVDVPVVDTVVFADPHRSPVDIAQATGRAVRIAPGKTRGRIVLAVVLEPDLDEDTALASGAWHHVWAVLRALTVMDPRFEAVLRRPHRHRPPGGRRAGGPTLQVRLPDGFDLHTWMLRTLDRTGSSWQRHLAALRDWATVHGHTRPTGDLTHNGLFITRWVRRQQYLFQAGRLEPDKIDALNALPRWAWTVREAAWWHAAELWHQAHDSGIVGQDRWAVLTELPAHPHPDTQYAYRTLAEFAVDTDGQHRRGELPGHLITAAEQLPGWVWHLLPDHDATMVDTLLEYGAWQRDYNPPHHYRHDDDLPLGSWLTAVRRRHLTGRIEPPLHAQLAILARGGSRSGRRAIRRLRWETEATAWRLGYLALLRYVNREHRVRTPMDHIEALPDHQVNLHQWCHHQRGRHRAGVLDPTYTALLEHIPGWQWDIPLRDAGRPHTDTAPPSTTSYSRGCRCDDCTTAHRHHDTHRRAASKIQPFFVDVGPARTHVRMLRRNGATNHSISRAANVHYNTIYAIHTGTKKRIRADTARKILALTPETIIKQRTC